MWNSYFAIFNQLIDAVVYKNHRVTSSKLKTIHPQHFLEKISADTCVQDLPKKKVAKKLTPFTLTLLAAKNSQLTLFANFAMLERKKERKK
jgi:hypothetical protein